MQSIEKGCGNGGKHTEINIRSANSYLNKFMMSTSACSFL